MERAREGDRDRERGGRKEGERQRQREEGGKRENNRSYKGLET